MPPTSHALTLLAAFLALSAAIARPSTDAAVTAAPPAVTGPEEVVEFWPGGAPRRVYQVDGEGRRHGDYREYRITGELLVRATYRDGELSGRYESFHANGERHVDCRYSKGLLDGRYNEFDEAGERRVTGRYDDGLKDGDFEYRRDGDVVGRQEWKDGALVEIDGFRDPFPRSVDALRAELEAIRALPIEPVLESEYEGAIDPELAEQRVAALKRLMEYRALSGLAYADMELDPKYDWHCSAAARLLTRIGRLDHTPPNPGLPEDEYKVAYEGTSKSNLAMGSSLPGSIDSYMDDSDPSNIDRVGHRRWCLNPPMKRTGFGIDGRYSAMWSFDESRGRGTSWDLVAYPAPGYYPSSHVANRAAWSVRFRPGVLDGLEAQDVEVELYALDDELVRGAPMRLDHLSLYGGQVIFRGTEVDRSPGRAYEVRILEKGTRSSEELLRYYVRFVDLWPEPEQDRDDDLEADEADADAE